MVSVELVVVVTSESPEGPVGWCRWLGLEPSIGPDGGLEGE